MVEQKVYQMQHVQDYVHLVTFALQILQLLLLIPLANIQLHQVQEIIGDIVTIGGCTDTPNNDLKLAPSILSVLLMKLLC